MRSRQNFTISVWYITKQKIDLGTIMSRINGFVGRRDLLKAGWEGRCDYCGVLLTGQQAVEPQPLLLKKTSTS